MKIYKRVILLLLLGLVIGSVDAAGIKISVTTEKKSFYPGEPILLLVRIRNERTHPIRLDLGHSNLGAFSFRLYQPDSDLNDKDSLRQIKRPGPSWAPFIKVGASSETSHPIILNQWCSTLLPPGEYRLDCSISGYYISDPTNTDDQGYINLEFPPDVNQSLNFQIKSENLDQQRTVIRDISNILYGSADNRTSVSVEIATKKILFAETEDTLDFKIAFMLITNDYWKKREALTAIEMLKSPEAQIVLQQILDDPTKKKSVEAIRGLIQDYIDNKKPDPNEAMLLY